MTFPQNPQDRFPKGDHNRRLALKMDPDVFAAEAGISVEALREYELTEPGGAFDLEVAQRVGAALERLEASPAADVAVDNGDVPEQQQAARVRPASADAPAVTTATGPASPPPPRAR